MCSQKYDTLGDQCDPTLYQNVGDRSIPKTYSDYVYEAICQKGENNREICDKDECCPYRSVNLINCEEKCINKCKDESWKKVKDGLEIPVNCETDLVADCKTIKDYCERGINSGKCVCGIER